MDNTKKKTYLEDIIPFKKDVEGNRYYVCPVCHTGTLKVLDGLFYGRCDNCGATLIDYKPLPHQYDFHKSNSRYRLNIGGYGSGKCVLGTTRVATEKGYIKIKDLYNNPKEGFNEFKIKVHTNDGLKETSHFYYEKNCKVNILELANGSTINGTDKHKVNVLRSLKPTMVRMDEIKVGDTLLFNSVKNVDIKQRKKDLKYVMKLFNKFGNITEYNSYIIYANNFKISKLKNIFDLYGIIYFKYKKSIEFNNIEGVQEIIKHNTYIENYITVIDKRVVYDDVYDLTVPNGHLFMAQGLLNHNTTASCAEITFHCFEKPNSKALITAISLKQVKDAVLPELMKFLPPWHIKKYTRSPTPNIKLKNGSEILVYSSENPDKIRSLNLTAFYIEEASGVKYEIFDQLMVRLRNKAGVIFDKDGNEIGYRFMGILSTNPEDGWIKDDFLLKSGVLKTSPSVDVNIYKPLMKPPLEKNFHSFISSTRDNNNLPKSYLEGACAGKSDRWIRKYIDCYLDNKEGVVYPDYLKNVVEPFPIPDTWRRVIGFDPGYSDPTAIPKGAVDPKTGIIYIYDDYEVSEKPISHHARELKKDLAGLRLLIPIQADPSVNKRNDRDGTSYADYFLMKSGLYLEPANNDILYGIEKVRDYMENGKLKFFSSCQKLKMEAMNYAYPQKDKNNNDLPIDNYNHLWDAIRYFVAKLPRDPNQLNGVYLQNNALNRSYSAFSLDRKNEEELPLDSYEDYNEVYGGIKL